MFAITEGEAITINEGKRSAGSRGRGIGIRVCVGKNEYPLMKEVKKERPAKEGRAVFALDSEELRLRKTVLTLSSTMMASLACVWVATYAVLGLWVSAAIPFGYQLASALSTLLANPPLAACLGQAARRRAEQKFSLRRQVNSLLRLWSRMLEEPSL